MPPAVIDVGGAEDSRDVVHRAVQALAEGKIVAFPTETVYGLAASALNPDAVRRLGEIKGRPGQQPFALAVKSADDALDYVPDVSPLGRRLARRCWPGPLTIVLPDSHPDSLVHQLPTGVQEAVLSTGSIGLRVPAHSLVTEVLRLLAGPLVLTSANRSAGPDTTEASGVIDQLGGDVDLILDDGRCQFGQPSTVVRVDENGLRVLRAGVVSDATLRRLASYMLLFVCTGNTCRSPMAELMCRSRLASRVGCASNVLEDHGFLVMSAGIAAMGGGRASDEAIRVMLERQLDLSGHEAQPLSSRLVRFADLILTMTSGHRAAIIGHWPEATDRTVLLSSSGSEISDPVGGPLELYRQCADQIEGALVNRIAEIDTKPLGSGISTDEPG